MIRNIVESVYNGINCPAISRRRHQRQGMPAVQLGPEHVSECQVLTDRQSLLARMTKNAVVCELGVADGAFNGQIIQAARPSVLVLIDAWHTERYAPDEGVVRNTFASAVEAGSVKIIKGLSTEVLDTFPDDYFDYIYIDTNHSYETTRDELLIAERVVKPDGLILGHDYCLGTS